MMEFLSTTTFWVMVWGFVSSYFIIGVGFKMPALRSWEKAHMHLPKRTLFYVIMIRGGLFWPWCNVDKLWKEYP